MGDMGFLAFDARDRRMGMWVCCECCWREAWPMLGFASADLVRRGDTTLRHIPPALEHDRLQDVLNTMSVLAGCEGQNGKRGAT